VSAPSGRKRALVIDDTYESRYYVKTVLTALGYEVDEAATVEEAFTKNPESHDLLVIDLYIGAGRGTDIIEHLRAHAPNVLPRCILMTGALIDDAPEEVTTLRKPVEVETLIRAVRQVSLQ
jgi:CheY-like chemotaxis protein